MSKTNDVGPTALPLVDGAPRHCQGEACLWPHGCDCGCNDCQTSGNGAGTSSTPSPERDGPDDDDDGPWYAGAIGCTQDDDSLVYREDAVFGEQFYASSPGAAARAAGILNALERKLADRARYEAACDNVSGALTDAGGVVPGDVTRYGEAVRKLTAERNEARRDLFVLANESLDDKCLRLVVQREKAAARVAELEGALYAMVKARDALSAIGPGPSAERIGPGFPMTWHDWWEDRDEAARHLNASIAALTPSAAKPESDPDLAPMCVLCGHSRIVHVLGGPCSGTPDLSPCQVRCKGFVSAPAAKCGTCGGTGFVDGGEGGAMPPCPACATPAAGEQRWGVWSDTRNVWLRAAGREVQGTQQEMARFVEAVLNDSPVLRGKYEARPLPPAAKGAK